MGNLLDRKGLNVKILLSYMKSFLAYCIFVLQASEAAEAEQVNTYASGILEKCNYSTSRPQQHK